VVVTDVEELNTGLNAVVGVILVPGAHAYVKGPVPPDSVVVIVALVFTQTVGPALGVIVGLALTVIVLVPLELQPPAVYDAVMVYTVVVVAVVLVKLVPENVTVGELL